MAQCTDQTAISDQHGATSNGGDQNLQEQCDTCVFCQDPLKAKLVGALPCGHVFHNKCLDEYKDAVSLPEGRLCPFKCWQVTEMVPDVSAESVLAQSASPQPLEDIQRLLDDELGAVSVAFQSA